MTISLYDLSVPVFVRAFNNLSSLLNKAVAHANETGTDVQDLVQSRLIEDMRPLAAQIQFASDSAKGAGGRLAAVEMPRFEDSEVTVADLQARIAKTVLFLEGLDRAKFDGAEGREVVVKTPTSELKFTGLEYLQNFALPNFFFHIVTAYGILRHKGVPLGKQDFLRG